MSFDPELYVTINLLTMGTTSGISLSCCLFQLSEGVPFVQQSVYAKKKKKGFQHDLKRFSTEIVKLNKRQYG